MDLHINKIPTSNAILIPVAGELINKPLSDYTHIICENKKYAIHGSITHNKGDAWPKLLPILSTGKYFSESDVFEVYKKSDRVVFFIACCA